MILSRKEQRKLKKSINTATARSPTKSIGTIRSPTKSTDASTNRLELLFAPQSGHVDENAQAFQDITTRWRSESLATSSTECSTVSSEVSIDQDRFRYSLPSVFYDSEHTTSTLTSESSSQEQPEDPSTDVTRSSPIPITTAKRPLTSFPTAKPSPDFGSPLERVARLDSTTQHEEASSMASYHSNNHTLTGRPGADRSDSTTSLIFPLSPFSKVFPTTKGSPQTPKQDKTVQSDEYLYDQTPVATVRATRNRAPSTMRVSTEHADADLYCDDDDASPTPVEFAMSEVSNDYAVTIGEDGEDHEVSNDDAVTVGEEEYDDDDDLIYKQPTDHRHFNMEEDYTKWVKRAEKFIDQVKQKFHSRRKYEPFDELIIVLRSFDDATVIKRSDVDKVYEILWDDNDSTVFDDFHDFMPLRIARERPHFPTGALGLSGYEQLALDALVVVAKYTHISIPLTREEARADPALDSAWVFSAGGMGMTLERYTRFCNDGASHDAVDDIDLELLGEFFDDRDSLSSSTPELGRQMMPSSIAEHAREQHEKMLARTATMNARDQALFQREKTSAIADAESQIHDLQQSVERITRLEIAVQASEHEIERLKTETLKIDALHHRVKELEAEKSEMSGPMHVDLFAAAAKSYSNIQLRDPYEAEPGSSLDPTLHGSHIPIPPPTFVPSMNHLRHASAAALENLQSAPVLPLARPEHAVSRPTYAQEMDQIFDQPRRQRYYGPAQTSQVSGSHASASTRSHELEPSARTQPVAAQELPRAQMLGGLTDQAPRQWYYGPSASAPPDEQEQSARAQRSLARRLLRTMTPQVELTDQPRRQWYYGPDQAAQDSGSHEQQSNGVPQDGESGEHGKGQDTPQDPQQGSQQEPQDTKGKGRANSLGHDSAYAPATEDIRIPGGSGVQGVQSMCRPEPVTRKDLPAFATKTLPFSGTALRQALFKRCDLVDDGTDPQCIKDLLFELVKTGKVIPPIHTVVPDTWEHDPTRYGGGRYTPGVHISGEEWQVAIEQAEAARQSAVSQTVKGMKDMIGRMIGMDAEEQKRAWSVRNQ